VVVACKKHLGGGYERPFQPAVGELVLPQEWLHTLHGIAPHQPQPQTNFFIEWTHYQREVKQQKPPLKAQARGWCNLAVTTL
jgi:hypothetical protein